MVACNEGNRIKTLNQNRIKGEKNFQIIEFKRNRGEKNKLSFSDYTGGCFHFSLAGCQ